MARIVDRLSKQRYDQFELERWVKGFWERERVYERVREKSMKSGRKFYFLDGPPYASAKSIHVGTAWNKVVKDVVLRYYRMRGYMVWDRPGFDVHGLPIEVKIEQKLGVRVKKQIMEDIGVARFINECKAFVDENMKAMEGQFKELGVFMDWENPYVTYTDEYIESGWWLIKRAHERGLLYRGSKVVHWCPRCETTLADYEVSEYVELEDPSIYVKFPLKGGDASLLVWTTTPWTLPANTFIMAHPEMEYVKVRARGETLILARSRLEEVMREAGIEEYEVLESFKGEELEGLQYVHPLEDLVDAQRELSRHHRIVLAPEAVAGHEGTGLVHSAPGHGTVDYDVAARTGAPIVSLVDESGRMEPGSGKYSGLYFRGEANEAILEDLRSRGALFHESTIRHRYPVCWRCKTPLALRAADQWFIAVTKLKDEMVREAGKIEWRPSWAKARFSHVLRELRDWVISRQRFWGIPLPIWTCSKCGHIRVVGSVKELEELGGRRPPNLHRPWIDEVKLRCPMDGGEMRRVPDVLDVWFDSGISFYASLGYPLREGEWTRLKPVDFIVEGHDQIRGWFFSLLRSGVIGFGEAPYRNVLVHGFALDEQGREMHKSLGNYVEFEELVSRAPRDVIRLWLTQNTVWEDLRFSWKGLALMQRDFNIIWNVYNFAATYMGLDSYDPERDPLERVEDSLELEDRWLLSRLNRLIKRYHEAMGDYRLHEASRLLREFIVEDVSHWYIRLIRRRVWEEEDTPSKRAAYATLYEALKSWLLLSAPFIPHTAEYLYQHFLRGAEAGNPASVHLLDLPVHDEEWIDEDLEEKMEIVRRVVESVMAARNKVGLKLRMPVKRVIIATSRDKVASAVRELSGIVMEMSNAKGLSIEGHDFFERAKVYRVEPNYKELGPSFKELTPKVASLLAERAGEVARSMLEKGAYEAVVGGERVRIEPRHVKVVAEYPSWMSVVEEPEWIAAIDTRVTREEIMEGYAREVVRRIQHMRKELGLEVEDRVNVWLSGDQELVEATKSLEDYVKAETRAVKVLYIDPPRGVYAKLWNIEDKEIMIGVQRA